MSTDIYDRHRKAVEMWQKACQDVEYAENERRLARNVLDNIAQELTEMFADTAKRQKPTGRRGRKPKVNGAEMRTMRQSDLEHFKASQ